MALFDEFQTVDFAYSPIPFWYLNGDLKKEELSRQIDLMIGQNIFSAVLQARNGLFIPYLSDAWWDIIRFLCETAKSKKFKFWISDEYNEGSGKAGVSNMFANTHPFSQVLDKDEANQKQSVEFYTKIFDGGKPVTWEISEATGRPLAAFSHALDHDGNFTDLGEAIEFSGNSVPLSLPRGEHFVSAFFIRKDPEKVNLLRAETVRDFIGLVHEQYKKHVGGFFGDTIIGFYSSAISIGEHHSSNLFSWKDGFADMFKEKFAYDIVPLLPDLISDRASEKCHQIRHDYFEICTSLLSESFFAQISTWCKENNLKFFGSYLGSDIEFERKAVGCFFSHAKYLDIQCASNFGKGSAENIGRVKSIASNSNHLGQIETYVKAFEGYGWALSPLKMKTISDRYFCYGISRILPCAFYYQHQSQGGQIPEEDIPPELDSQPSQFFMNPYWHSYKIFSKYTARLSKLFETTKHVAQVLLYHPISSHWTDAPQDSNGSLRESHLQICSHLLENQVDFNLADDQALQAGQFKNHTLEISGHAYELIIIPRNIDAMPVKTAELLRLFVEKGGSVLFAGAFPYRNIRKETTEQSTMEILKKLEEDAPGLKGKFRHLNPAPRFSAVSPALMDTLHEILEVDFKVVEGNKEGLLYRKQRDPKSGAHIYFICNVTPDTRQTRISFRSLGTTESWDAETGECEHIQGNDLSESASVLALNFEPWQSRLVVFYPKIVEEKRIVLVNDRHIDLKDSWQMELAPLSEQSTPFQEKKESWLPIPFFGFVDQAMDPTGYDPIDPIWRFSEFRKGLSTLSSDWKAKWICPPAKQIGIDSWDTCYFRNIVELTEAPLKAWITASATDTYEIYINGKLAANGKNHREPGTHNLTHHFRRGWNLFAVKVTSKSKTWPYIHQHGWKNFTPSALIIQGEISTKNKKNVSLQTNEAWTVHTQEAPGWNNKQLNLNWDQAVARGTPPVLPFGDISFLGFPAMYPRTVWYQVPLPAGTIRVKAPVIQGEWTAFLDGEEVQFDKLKIAPSAPAKSIYFKVKAKTENDGLQEPIEVLCEPRTQQLTDWSELNLRWYSGKIIYKNSFEINKLKKGRVAFLDLGELMHSAEAFLNDQPVGVRLWTPFLFDLSPALKEGRNELKIIVSNLLANRKKYASSIPHEGRLINKHWFQDSLTQDSLRSGLLGPVRVKIQRQLKISVQ